jgi:HSP20 family protein
MPDAPNPNWRPYPTFPLGRRLDGRVLGRIEGEGNLLVPSLHVVADEDGYTVIAAIPAVERDELTVSFQQGVLRISGERRRHTASRGPDARRETAYLSRFTREIRLDREIDVLEAEAHFENGELTVRLPIIRRPRARQEDDPTLVEIR